MREPLRRFFATDEIALIKKDRSGVLSTVIGVGTHIKIISDSAITDISVVGL